MEETGTIEFVRNAVIASVCGHSRGIGGKPCFRLLSDRPWVRIPPGSPFCLPDKTDLPLKGSCEAGRIFLFQDAAERKKSANRRLPPLEDF